MNLHEYQGKALFAEYNLPVSKGKVVFKAEDIIDACNEIGGSKWVVKAQVHAGGRGKSGGVELINNPEDGVKFAQKWLGKNLVTYQTDKKGQPVNCILVEECTNIAKELYLSAIIDRESQQIVFIGSSEGGVNIEDVAKNMPEKIIYQGFVYQDDSLNENAENIAKVLKLNIGLRDLMRDDFIVRPRKGISAAAKKAKKMKDLEKEFDKEFDKDDDEDKKEKW